MTRPPPTSTLFPYTTLFRSSFLRMWLTWTSSERSKGVIRRWWMMLISSPRETARPADRSEEHTSELQSRRDLVCRLLLEKKKKKKNKQRDTTEINQILMLTT